MAYFCRRTLCFAVNFHIRRHFFAVGLFSKFRGLIEGSEFVFDFVHLFYYKCHKINPNCGGSCKDAPDCIKSKKATINSINKKDNTCFQYAVTVAVNHKKIKKIRK